MMPRMIPSRGIMNERIYHNTFGSSGLLPFVMGPYLRELKGLRVSAIHRGAENPGADYTGEENEIQYYAAYHDDHVYYGCDQAILAEPLIFGFRLPEINGP
jgi:hypothetical protein